MLLLKIEKPFFFLLVGAALLGFAAIFVKLASAEASSEVIGFYRMLFALPIAFLMMGKKQTQNKKKEKIFVSLAGVMFASYLYLWHIAISLTSAANATFIIGMSPLWVAIINIYFGHRFNKLFFVGLAIAIFGASLLAISKGATLHLAKGEIFSLLASLGYAILTIVLTKGRKNLKTAETLFFMILGSFITFCIIIFFKQSSLGPFSLNTWSSLLGLGLIVQIAAWIIITKSMSTLNSSVVSIGLLNQQVITPFLGILILNETLSLMDGIGGGILIFGIFIASLKKNPLVTNSK